MKQEKKNYSNNIYAEAERIGKRDVLSGVLRLKDEDMSQIEDDSVFDLNNIKTSVNMLESNDPIVLQACIRSIIDAIHFDNDRTLEIISFELFNRLFEVLLFDETRRICLDLISTIQSRTTNFCSSLLNENAVCLFQKLDLSADEMSVVYNIYSNILCDEPDSLGFLIQVGFIQSMLIDKKIGGYEYRRFRSIVMSDTRIPLKIFFELLSDSIDFINSGANNEKKCNEIYSLMILSDSERANVLIEYIIQQNVVPKLFNISCQSSTEISYNCLTLFENFSSRSDVFNMVATVNDFAPLLHRHMLGSHEQNIMQAIRCLCHYSSSCLEFADKEATIFYDFPFESMFNNGGFYLKQSIVSLLNNLLPRFPIEIISSLLTDSFISSISELFHVDDSLTRQSLYRFFGYLFESHDFDPSKLIHILSETEFVEYAEEDSLSNDESLSLHSTLFLDCLRKFTN